MKIHFMAAVDGNQKQYKQILDTLEKLGHHIVTYHYVTRHLSEIKTESHAESELYAKKVQKWLKEAEVVIYEVTKSDVNVGYELALALNMSKPVIVMYDSVNGEEPFSLKGIVSDRLQIIPYQLSTLEEILELSIDYAKETSDIRFNFFVTPTISSYLDWVAKEKKLPRSVYLRRLIEDDMGKNDDFGDT